MIDFQKKIEKIQNQPYEVRIKILWAVVAACALILLAIWIFSLKNTFSNVDSKNLIQTRTTVGSETPESENQFVAVERIEKTATNLKIYFNLNNNTDDILNVPKLESITLDAGKHPVQILDRQGQLFVQKVLSHTQNFGILMFGKVEADNGKLIFDQLFFEKNPEKVFKQTLDLDFNKLINDAKLRN